MFPFERPYPDELVSSALTRGCRHFGIPWTSLAAQAGRTYRWRPTFLGAPLLEAWEALFRLDASVVMSGHTLLPYLRAFSPPEPSEDVTSTLSSYLLPLTRVITCRRFCLACVRAQLKTYGESFWCRSHHLPAVEYCPTHSTPLLRAPLSALGTFGEMLLPHEVTGQMAERLPNRLRASWRKLAVRSVKALLQVPESRGPAYYLALAVKNNWLTQDEQVSSALLGDALTRYFGKRLLQANGLSVSPDAVSPWFSLLLRNSSPFGSPTWKHLVMEQLLEHGNAQLELAIGHKPVGAKKDYRELDTFVSKQLASRIKMVEKLRTSLTRTDLMREAGVLHLYRQRRESLPASQAILDHFSASASCARPSSMFAFSVQGISDRQKRLTRAALIASGQLIGSKAMAARLGVHWTEMARLTREGRIITVVYQGRNYYPALWPRDSQERALFEAVARKWTNRPGLQAYSLLVAPQTSFSGRSLADVLRTGRGQLALAGVGSLPQ